MLAESGLGNTDRPNEIWRGALSRFGSLIVVEGPDGVGKTSVSAAVSARLDDLGIPCRTYAFPGNEAGTLGHLVYRLHHEPNAIGVSIVSPLALQTAHIAAHLDSIERVFRPTLQAGTNIILDRYWWSTFVYGIRSGISRSILESLVEVERMTWGEVKPLLIFRIETERPWRESEDNPDWYDVAEEYRELAKRESTRERVVVVDNRRNMEEVVTDVSTRIAAAMGVHERPSNSDSSATQSLLPFESTQSAPIGVRYDVRVNEGWPRPTKVYDTFWRFAADRQEIYYRRLAGSPWPWSADPILQRYRFTNAYRASDRVSQFLIKNVQYGGDQSTAELFFRTILFKLFNKIETWEVLLRRFNEPNYAGIQTERYIETMEDLKRGDQRIYSGAYIMPPAPGGRGSAKHVGHLRLLEKMMGDHLPDRLSEASSMRSAYETLHAYPMMGEFLAFQYTVDLNYSAMLSFSEMDFVVAGPGAKRGILKCFCDIGNRSYEDVIRHVTDNQIEEFERRDIKFGDLWGRPLQLVDIQNLFCEVDKYSRVAHPELNEENNRKRIKQIYRPHGPSPVPWYPPKWGLNEKIQIDER